MTHGLQQPKNHTDPQHIAHTQSVWGGDTFCMGGDTFPP